MRTFGNFQSGKNALTINNTYVINKCVCETARIPLHNDRHLPDKRYWPLS